MRRPILPALLLSLAFTTLPAAAQRTFDVTPLIGYRLHSTFAVQSEDEQTRGRAGLRNGENFGIAAGIRFDEDSVIEFRWMRQNTGLRVEGNLNPTANTIGASMDQFHLDFTKEYLFRELPRLRPFIVGSVGATRVATSIDSFARFSFGVGTGIKYFPSRRVGFRAQVQYSPIFLSPDIRFVCTGACVTNVGARLAHQFEVAVGPVFTF